MPAHPITSMTCQVASEVHAPPAHGCVAVAITPCHSPGQVSPDCMTELCHQLTRHGSHGVFVLGSTGELPLLDQQARQTLIVAARQGCSSSAKLYAGVSGTGLNQIKLYTQQAADLGADVAIVMAPFFLKLDQHQLTAYIEEIADTSPIPIGIYHHLRMPTAFDVNTVKVLGEHPNISVMKDTSNDLSRMRDLVAVTSNADIALLQGSESIIYDSLQAGAQGCVTALAGIAPEWHLQLFNACRDNNHTQAVCFQDRIMKLSQLFQLDPVGQSFAHFAHTLRYTACKRGWIESTASMLPGFEPSRTFEQQIERIIHDCGLVTHSDVELCNES